MSNILIIKHGSLGDLIQANTCTAGRPLAVHLLVCGRVNQEIERLACPELGDQGVIDKILDSRVTFLQVAKAINHGTYDIVPHVVHILERFEELVDLVSFQ